MTAQPLKWDKQYSELQIEPHLRSATPLVLPAYALHLSIWLHADERIKLSEEIFRRFVKFASNRDEVELLRHSIPLQQFDPANYYVSNCSWDWEVRRAGKPLYVCRLELHQEYCSITVFIPWRGRKWNEFNHDFWKGATDRFSTAAEGQSTQRLDKLYADGLKDCIDFLKDRLDLDAGLLAGGDVKEAPFAVFGAFQGLAVPESMLWGDSAFEFGEGGRTEAKGRFVLQPDKAEDLLSRISQGPPEHMPGSGGRVACGMLKGQVLYTSTIGFQVSTEQPETLRYLVVYPEIRRPTTAAVLLPKEDQFNWPLSRLMYRLHEIGTRRLAALRDLQHIWRTGTELRKLEAEAELIELGERGHQADKHLRTVISEIYALRKRFRERGERHDPKNPRHNLDDRLASAGLYASAVRSLVDGLDVQKLATYQDYHQFIWRRLYRRFEYIRLFGRRLDRLHERTRGLIQHRLQDRGDSLQSTAHVIGAAIFGGETSAFLSAALSIEAWNTVEEGIARFAFLLFGVVTYIVAYLIVRWRFFPRPEAHIDK